MLGLLEVLRVLRGWLSKAQRHRVRGNASTVQRGGRLKGLVQALELWRVCVREVRWLAVFELRRAIWKARVEVGRGARFV